MQIGSFGSLVFEVSNSKIVTPKTVKREMSAVYEEHKVLGSKPRLEFLAPELNSVSLSVLLSAALGVDPVESMTLVESLIKDGVVEKLILGGINYGNHVLVKASEEWKTCAPSGKPMSVQISLEFKEYANE